MYIHIFAAEALQLQVNRKFKVFRQEVKALVTDLHSQEKRTLYLYGNWNVRSMAVYVGGKKKDGGRLLAHCQKVTVQAGSWNARIVLQEYLLTVLAGTDHALCVLLCSAFDELYRPPGEGSRGGWCGGGFRGFVGGGFSGDGGGDGCGGGGGGGDGGGGGC